MWTGLKDKTNATCGTPALWMHVHAAKCYNLLEKERGVVTYNPDLTCFRKWPVAAPTTASIWELSAISSRAAAVAAQLLLFGGGGAGGQVGTARTRAMIISDVQVAQAKSSSIECPEQAELHHEAHNPDLLGG